MILPYRVFLLSTPGEWLDTYAFRTAPLDYPSQRRSRYCNPQVDVKIHNGLAWTEILNFCHSSFWQVLSIFFQHHLIVLQAHFHSFSQLPRLRSFVQPSIPSASATLRKPSTNLVIHPTEKEISDNGCLMRRSIHYSASSDS